VGAYEVELISVDGRTTALGSAGPFTLVVDPPVEAGGGGQGFSGGQLLNLAVGGCISNDLFREAARAGINLRRVRVTAHSDYVGSQRSRRRFGTTWSSKATPQMKSYVSWSSASTGSRRYRTRSAAEQTCAWDRFE
jgi:organic hydroperoxide reductase OsmC/OhrA